MPTPQPIVPVPPTIPAPEVAGDDRAGRDANATGKPALTPRKEAIRRAADASAQRRDLYRRRAAYYHEEDIRYLRFLIPEGLKILEIGCGGGEMLAALRPDRGVGIDLSPAMIAHARARHPEFEFHVGDPEEDATLAGISGPFDVVLIVDTIGHFDDCQRLLERLHPLCTRSTRLVVAYYSHLWRPALALAEALGWRAKTPADNIFSPADVRALAEISGFETIRSEKRLLVPFRLLGLGRLVNRFLSPLPFIRHLGFRHYTVGRSLRAPPPLVRSATVVIPARNERGNIEPAVRRLPDFADLEIFFVEGHSRDGTFEEIERVRAAYPDRDIKAMRQPGIGKADAVFAAFDQARGDVLMILDADLTVPPEQLPKFWNAIADGTGEFINGTRLFYPREDAAMRPLNLAANRTFSLLFSWLLNQRVTDTLCGTKVIRRDDYRRLKAGRTYFGDFDPFGDFDLIFGAAKLNLKCVEIPIRYAARTYGTTQISRFRHGFMLMRMVVLAFLRIKAL